MKPELTDIDKIKSAFSSMNTKQDFLDLLNLAKPMIYGENAVPFQRKQLTFYSGKWSKDRKYRQFTIRKKSGSERTINAPVSGLKTLQKTIAFVLQCIFEPHEAAKGFVRGMSIVDNARIHENSRYVYNIDLKDFFPSIDQARVWKCLQLKPFNLIEEYPAELLIDGSNENSIIRRLAKEGETCVTQRLKIANMIAAICCAELEAERKDEKGQWIKLKKNVLPQGAPTSPVLTNVVCQKLDFLLTGVAKRFGLRYSRYADDITFSSMHNVYQKDSKFIKELNRIIDDQGFTINEKKTRLQKEGYRKEVTGLLVNEKVNVQKRYVKQVRMWLYYWERYGYDIAYQYFLQQYIKDKGHLKTGKPEMSNVIDGKLQYLKMVKGTDNDLYLKLNLRYERIIKKEDKIEMILDTWEKFGIQKAINTYYENFDKNE